MSKPLSMIAVLGTVTLGAACGAGHDATGKGGAGATGGTMGRGGAGGAVDRGLPPLNPPPCVSGGNSVCLPSGFPFVRAAFAHSYACISICSVVSPAGTTIVLSQPVPGTLCLSGTNPAANGTGLAMAFTELAALGPVPDRFMVLSRLNADLLNITQLRFTIDNPPPGGLAVSATTVHSDVCNGIDCITFGFTLPTRITASGTTTAALVDFVSDPPQAFDTRALDSVDFAVGPGDFDFCVRDLQFLDANGAVVTPMP